MKLLNIFHKKGEKPVTVPKINIGDRVDVDDIMAQGDEHWYVVTDLEHNRKGWLRYGVVRYIEPKQSLAGERVREMHRLGLIKKTPRDIRRGKKPVTVHDVFVGFGGFPEGTLIMGDVFFD